MKTYKTYKGLELFKAVMNYELPAGTKLKCIYYPLYGQGIEVDEKGQILIWSNTKKPVDYIYFYDDSFDFKVIKEEKEEEKKIEKLNPEECYFKDGTELVYKLMYNKINKLIDEINRLKSDKNE